MLNSPRVLQTGYGFSRSVFTMIFPVGYCCFFGSIGIAVFALVGTGIVFSDVFAGDAATVQALSFIFVILFMYDLYRIEKPFIAEFDSKVVH